jgi:hypothetical protein
MARAAIFDKVKQLFSSISDKQDRNARFNSLDHKAVVVSPRQRITSVKNVDFPLSDFYYRSTTILPESILPFRVRFMNIGIEGYGPNNPAPIGIAVIGFNNYIL